MAFQIPVYGEQALSFNPGLIKVTAESQNINYNDSSPVVIGTIKANQKILVVGAIVNIKTAFAGTSPTLDIGIATDPDRYADTADIVPTTAGIKIKFNASGSPAEENPTSDQNVLATIGGTGLTAGVASVRLLYIDIADL